MVIGLDFFVVVLGFFFTVRGSQTLAEVVQRSCGISILGDIQNMMRRSPGQPAVADAALSKGVGRDDLQRPPPASAFL